MVCIDERAKKEAVKRKAYEQVSGDIGYFFLVFCLFFDLDEFKGWE